MLQDSPRTSGIIAGTGSGPEYTNFLQTRGSIPSLEAFDWLDYEEYNDPLFCFLEANKHLSMLSLQNPLSALLLETRLLPLLCNSFSRLPSLSLSWDHNSISESALKMVSALKSLQQQHLSAGSLLGWKHDFAIDHETMRRHIQKINSLKKLAFSRDSYSTRATELPREYYYVAKFFPEWDPVGFEEREQVWEKMHLDRMLTKADQYGLIIPQLEWLFVGQIRIINHQ